MATRDEFDSRNGYFGASARLSEVKPGFAVEKSPQASVKNLPSKTSLSEALRQPLSVRSDREVS